MSTETLPEQNPIDQDLPDPSPTVQESPEQGPTDAGAPDQSVASQDMSEYLTNGYDFKALRRGDLRTGVVIETNERGLTIDIVGFKREGLVYYDDLERMDEENRAGIQIGDTVPVLVLRPENKEGYPILSIHQARLQEDWLKAEQMMESGELYEGEVAGYNRGGLIAKFGKIRGFIPASQIVGMPRRLREEQRRQRMAAMVGQRVGLRIIEVDRQRRRLIFSQRRALRAWQELQRERVISQLKEGDIRHGKVTSITNFGVFVDLGGADGLIHVSELSWSRVDNPREVMKVGEEVDVYVLDVDRERKRIALSLKKLQPDPWTLVDDHYQVGQLIEGRVTRVLDFGAFIELDLGIEGLLHASEMIGTPELSPSDIVHPKETLLVKIIRIESRRRRLALSARQVRRSEWERWVAEQQAAREAEAAAEEAVTVPEAKAAVGEAPVEEEEETPPEAELAVSEAAVEAAAPEAEAAVGEAPVEEEEETPPEAELAVSEAAEEATTPETDALEENVEETAAGQQAPAAEVSSALPTPYLKRRPSISLSVALILAVDH
jgi:small subunit ribosomal protein S1